MKEETPDVAIDRRSKYNSRKGKLVWFWKTKERREGASGKETRPKTRGRGPSWAG